MITVATLGLALLPLTYGFSAKTADSYDVTVKFDGFLPLMGGQEGKVEIGMLLAIAGKQPEKENLVATSEIKEFEVSFNGAKLPLDVSNVVEYFPKTTISLNPNGNIVESDAPDKKLPIRLPGLDIRHFADITYVPIEFPAEEPTVGLSWKFSREFAVAPIDYDCSLISESEGIWNVAVKINQTYKNFENASYEVVANSDDAVSEVITNMTGSGTVSFDAKNGRVISVNMVNQANSDVTELKSKKVSQRKLATTYAIKPHKTATFAKAKPTNSDFWTQTQEWTRNAINGAKTAWIWVQTATLFGLRALPKEFEQIRPMIRKAAPWMRF